MTTHPVANEMPLVVACLRITDLRPEVDPLTGAISRDAWGTGLAAADAAALEHALRAAEAWSGRVLAVAVGPASVEPVLRDHPTQAKVGCSNTTSGSSNYWS